MPSDSIQFVLLVYRMPTVPTTGRVGVWRQLKKMGAIYLQQSVCVFPDTQEVRRELSVVLRKIEEASGEYHLLPLSGPSPEERQKIVDQFQEQTSNHYAEIIENCEVNFQKEIEFETYRQNFTYEEAEEIRVEFEKIVAWFERVRARDWFGAPNQGEAKAWLERSEKLLEGFEARVFAAQEHEAGMRPPSRTRSRGRRRRAPAIPVAPGDLAETGDAPVSSSPDEGEDGVPPASDARAAGPGRPASDS
jgi:hypothetical protein